MHHELPWSTIYSFWLLFTKECSQKWWSIIINRCCIWSQNVFVFIFIILLLFISFLFLYLALWTSFRDLCTQHVVTFLLISNLEIYHFQGYLAVLSLHFARKYLVLLGDLVMIDQCIVWWVILSKVHTDISKTLWFWCCAMTLRL